MVQAIRLLGFVTLTLAWLIPNHYPPWTSFYNDACMGVGLALLASAHIRWLPRHTAAVAWAIASVAVIPWLQWWTGLLAFSGDAFIATLYLFGFASAVAIGDAAGRDFSKSHVDLLASSILIAAVLSAVLGMMQSLEVWGLGIWIGEIATGMRASANLLQSNNFATLLGWGALAILLLRERGRIGALTSILLLIVLLVACGFSQSRTSLVYGPIVWLGIAYARRNGVSTRTRLSTVAVVTVASWALIFITPRFLAAVDLTALQTVSERGAGSLRWQVWPILIDGLSQRPWSGYGWLQVGAAELASAHKFQPTGELYLQAHNLFLELLIWCGYPGGIILVAATLYWFASRWHGVKTVESLVAMSFVTVLAAHSMLEFPYQYAYFLLPLGLWMGTVESQRMTTIKPKEGLRHLVLPLSTLTLFLALCSEYPAVEEDFRLVRFETLQIGSLRAAAPAPDAPLLSTLTTFLRFSRTTPAPAMTAGQLQSMRDQARRYPYAASLYRVAASLALNGRSEEARGWFLASRYIHGEKLYQRLKLNLSDAIAESPSAGLLALQNSLP